MRCRTSVRADASSQSPDRLAGYRRSNDRIPHSPACLAAVVEPDPSSGHRGGQACRPGRGETEPVSPHASGRRRPVLSGVGQGIPLAAGRGPWPQSGRGTPRNRPGRSIRVPRLEIPAGMPNGTLLRARHAMKGGAVGRPWGRMPGGGALPPECLRAGEGFCEEPLFRRSPRGPPASNQMASARMEWLAIKPPIIPPPRFGSVDAGQGRGSALQGPMHLPEGSPMSTRMKTGTVQGKTQTRWRKR